MKISIGKKYNALVTFAFNMLLLDLLWQGLELLLYGEVRPSKEDAIIAFLFCLYIAYGGWRESRTEMAESDKGVNENDQTANQYLSAESE